MIQRIQSVYLLIVAILAGIGIYSPLWTNNKLIVVKGFDNIYILALFASVIGLSILTIFLFKNRKLQFVLGRVNILINIILLGVFGYYGQTFSGETLVSEKEIGLFVPIVSIVFLYLSNRAIKKDEELVKSVDRLR
jgi:membrane protease YdiL (CAAX protease family)